MNKMRDIIIDKVVINIGCGEAGEKLDKSKRMLSGLIEQKIVITKTHKRTTFGIGKGKPIGLKVTLRGKAAEEFLKRALDSLESKLSAKIFDTQGNFSFGIKEHISLAGVNYDPDIGIMGMDVCVRLKRRGFRVLVRQNPSKISKTHKIKPEESRQWLSENFNVKVVD